MYRVNFAKIIAQKTGRQSVAATTEISEAPKFTLGEVRLIGDDLPRDGMLKAAAFEVGKTATWRDIQQKIFALEIPVKRSGYFDAGAHPQRILRDEQRKVDWQISFTLGPLYHFGQIAFVGFPPMRRPRLTRFGRCRWAIHMTSPIQRTLREFSKKLDLRMYKAQFQRQNAVGDHMISKTIAFTLK